MLKLHHVNTLIYLLTFLYVVCETTPETIDNKSVKANNNNVCVNSKDCENDAILQKSPFANEEVNEYDDDEEEESDDDDYEENVEESENEDEWENEEEADDDSEDNEEEEVSANYEPNMFIQNPCIDLNDECSSWALEGRVSLGYPSLVCNC